MNNIDSVKDHWNNIFQTKDTSSVSWFEEEPTTSIELISRYLDSKQSSVIEIGGGDSKLPDLLLQHDYSNISILDISDIALQTSKIRLGEEAEKINWIVANVLDLDLDQKFNLWHDRAVFHFLHTEEEQKRYKEIMLNHLDESGVAIIAGFSKNNGPTKCSNLNVSQIDMHSILALFSPELDFVESFNREHITPSGSVQNFCWNILKIKKL